MSFTPETVAWAVLPFCIAQEEFRLSDDAASDQSTAASRKKPRLNWRLMLYRLACWLLAAGYAPDAATTSAATTTTGVLWNAPQPRGFRANPASRYTYSSSQRRLYAGILACIKEIRDVVDTQIVRVYRAMSYDKAPPHTPELSCAGFEATVLHRLYSRLLLAVDPHSNAAAVYSHYLQPRAGDQGAIDSDLLSTSLTTVASSALGDSGTIAPSSPMSQAAHAAVSVASAVDMLHRAWQVVTDAWASSDPSHNPFLALQELSTSVMNGFPDFNGIVLDADAYAWEAATESARERRNALRYARQLTQTWMGLSAGAPSLPSLVNDVFVCVLLPAEEVESSGGVEKTKPSLAGGLLGDAVAVTLNAPSWIPACVKLMLNSIDQLKHQQRFWLVTFLSVLTSECYPPEEWQTMELDTVLHMLQELDLFDSNSLAELQSSNYKNRWSEMRGSFQGEMNRLYHSRNSAALTGRDNFLRGCSRLVTDARVVAYNEAHQHDFPVLAPYCPFAKEEFVNQTRQGTAMRDIEDLGKLVTARSKHACAGERGTDPRSFHNAWTAYRAAHVPQ